jgi:hypothetical protein
MSSRGDFQEELQKQCIESLKSRAQKGAHLRQLLETCSDSILKEINHIFTHPKSEHGAFLLDDDEQIDGVGTLDTIIKPVNGSDLTYSLKYTGVIFKTHKPLDLKNELGCVPIQSFVNQVCVFLVLQIPLCMCLDSVLPNVASACFGKVSVWRQLTPSNASGCKDFCCDQHRLSSSAFGSTGYG